MTGPNRRTNTPFATSAERDALGAATWYVRTHRRQETEDDPPSGIATAAEDDYLDALEYARREITRRLVHGVLRGRPDGVPDAHVVDRESPAVPDAAGDTSRTLDGSSLLAAVEPLPESCRLLALQPFPSSETLLVVPIARRHGYDRFRLVGRISRLSMAANATEHGETTSDTLSHPGSVLALLESDGAVCDAEQADRLLEEVTESVVSLALAQLAKPVQARSVAKRVGSAGGTDTGTSGDSVFESVTSGIPAADSAAAFERIVTDGHPFHPAGKIRRGMGAADGLAYAPAFTDRIELRFVAIDRTYALETQAATTDESLTARLLAMVDGLESALKRALPAAEDPNAYAVVPVHPFQFYHTILDRYAAQCADGRVVPIPDCTQPVTPLLNLRTVVPVETESTAITAAAAAGDTNGTNGTGDTDNTASAPHPHLKLPLAVQTTNVVRTLSPQAVTNGPRVTALLNAITERTELESLGVLAESAATAYYAPGDSQPHTEGEAFDDARHLAGLLRTNPLAHSLVTEADDAVPVVASSLLADSPATGRPLVCDLVERYAAATDTTETAAAALSFVDAYADAVVPDQLVLMSGYGVALESHLQNSLIVFERETARPVGTVVRDLGGIRVHSGRLENHGLSFSPYPDSDLDTDDERELYRKLYYALFQNHLAELVVTLVVETGVDERKCWRVIRNHCEQGFDRARMETAGNELDTQIRRDERALFAPQATHKALTAMRLQGKRHEYVTSQVSNPLGHIDRETINF
ncbi:IucA/IucC family protein [Natrialba chahannaoensis]|nr:IucA/IucC family protein [Natrialba chahannaoensis]